MGKLTGKVALVTGATSGIGQAFAARLASDGASVAIVSRSRPADETQKMVEDAGAECLSYQADITSAEQVAGLKAAVEERFGSVDIVVNNAGIYPMKAFLEMEFSEWEEMFDINMHAMFHITQAFLGAMCEKGWGRVINVSSTSYMAGMANYTHYNATKGAVIGFTRSLAKEVGPQNVTVNSIAPGLVRTEITGSREGADEMFDAFLAEQCIKRTEEPKDLTGALSFLASDEASMVTGQTLLVDGGWMFT